MKLLVSMSAFSLVSSLALAADPAPSAAPAGKTDSGTKINMRVHLDPFYKNINDSAKNYKTPKVESLRLFVEREFGSLSKADVEIRLHELEKGENADKKAWYANKNDDGKALVNTDVLKYFHFLFKVPAVEGLEVGYVREMEPALHGYTDKPKSSNVVESPSFTGHMGRIEGFRAVYKMDPATVTYHVARNPNQNEYSLGSKPSDTTWYHKLTTNAKFGDTSVEAGLGVQGNWLKLDDSSKLKYDNFLHVVAESKIDDLKLKYGVAHDTYADTKLSDGKLEVAANTATTVLVGAKYELLPKEFTIIGEVGYRTLKLASDGFADFTDDKKTLVNSSSEASFVLAGQYFLDEKLSFIPSYNYYNSSRAQANISNTTGDALGDRKTLVKGSDRTATKTEHAFGLRIRYDY